MGQKTSIEWTDVTWNPVRGCSRVSKGPWKSPKVCRCGRCARCRHREVEADYRERRREARDRQELERIDAQIAKENSAIFPGLSGPASKTAYRGLPGNASEDHTKGVRRAELAWNGRGRPSINNQRRGMGSSHPATGATA